jgi:putative membrane protein
MDDDVMRTSWILVARVLPSVNAVFNLTSAALLWAGRRAIKQGRRTRHMRLMLSACASSTLFLVGYLVRLGLTGTHRFVGPWPLKWFYLALLISHMILAVVLLPLLARVLYLAWHARFAEHRAMARVAWPIWMYVSVTGVVVYAMLYHIAPALVP